MTHDGDLYGDTMITFLESMWGEGYLSPGGPEETGRLLEGIDLTGKTVLDIGSGAGGITLSLVRGQGAAQVIGLDVEAPVCARARQLVAKAGLDSRIEIRQVEPGPIPLPDESLDIVFSKDAIVHIPDKEALARDVFRLLRPGGWLVAADWLISHDGEPSPEMAYYLKKEDLDFGMASPRRYRQALEDAGFLDLSLRNRNGWYLGCAREELARLLGPERSGFEALIGADQVVKMVEAWEAMLPVLETGEHCPHHLRGRKP